MKKFIAWLFLLCTLSFMVGVFIVACFTGERDLALAIGLILWAIFIGWALGVLCVS